MVRLGFCVNGGTFEITEGVGLKQSIVTFLVSFACCRFAGAAFFVHWVGSGISFTDPGARCGVLFLERLAPMRTKATVAGTAMSLLLSPDRPPSTSSLSPTSVVLAMFSRAQATILLCILLARQEKLLADGKIPNWYNEKYMLQKYINQILSLDLHRERRGASRVERGATEKVCF